MSFANQALAAEWVLAQKGSPRAQGLRRPRGHRRRDRPPQAGDAWASRSTSSPPSRSSTSAAGRSARELTRVWVVRGQIPHRTAHTRRCLRPFVVSAACCCRRRVRCAGPRGRRRAPVRGRAAAGARPPGAARRRRLRRPAGLRGGRPRARGPAEVPQRPGVGAVPGPGDGGGGRPAAVDIVTWAPTTPARLRARGFDQARLLARAVARELRRPVPAAPAPAARAGPDGAGRRRPPHRPGFRRRAPAARPAGAARRRRGDHGSDGLGRGPGPQAGRRRDGPRRRRGPDPTRSRPRTLGYAGTGGSCGSDDSRAQRRGHRSSAVGGRGEGRPPRPPPRRLGARRGPLHRGAQPPDLGQGGLRGHAPGPRADHPGQGRLGRLAHVPRQGGRQARAPDRQAQEPPDQPVASQAPPDRLVTGRGRRRMPNRTSKARPGS